MWPWGHAALGYLLYTVYTRSGYDRPPRAIAIAWLAVGTQFPDLVDKPLAWTFGILPAGRTLAHTLLVAVPVVLVAYWVAQRRDRGEWGAAFGIGYCSHLLGDVLPLVLWGDLAEWTFLLWPLLPLPDFEGSSSIVAHFATLELTGPVAFELLLVGAAFVAWWYDGRPGTRLLFDRAVPADSR